MILAFVACTPLREGDWAVAYDEVTEDSCGLYNGGAALEDAAGELYWDAEVMVFEFDGRDDDLRFTLDGRELQRDATGSQPLGETYACVLDSDEQMIGEIITETLFRGETRWVGTLTGECAPYEQLFDPPCTVEFGWRGAFEG